MKDKTKEFGAIRVPKRTLLACAVIGVVALPWAHAQRIASAYEANFNAVRALLEQPESQMDLASIKLTIDQMIEPETDKAAMLRQIDGMAREIKATFPPGATNLLKFKSLRDYLYRPPPSSGRQPFVYNLEDDRNPRAKLLSVYLSTNKGNCVSMPLLFVILGQRLEVTLPSKNVPLAER